MKSKTFSLLLFALSLIPSAIAFYAGYHATDHLFRIYKFPYPFELFGIAAGLGSACWAYAVVKMFQWIARKVRKPSSPYTVESKIKINHAEVLK